MNKYKISDKEIFMESPVNKFSKEVEICINAIGRENYYNFISKYGGITTYFPTKIFSEKMNLEQLRNVYLEEPYSNYAETIGIENYYELWKIYKGKVKHVCKVERLIRNAKIEAIKKEIKDKRELQYIDHKEIFMNADISEYPHGIQIIVNEIGKENSFKLLEKFAHKKIYFSKYLHDDYSEIIGKEAYNNIYEKYGNKIIYLTSITGVIKKIQKEKRLLLNGRLIANKYNLSERTIYNISKKMKEEGTNQ